MEEQGKERKQPKIFKDLKHYNKGKSIKIRIKKGKKGYSLYLDNWLNGKRTYEFFKVYLQGTLESFLEDQEKLRQIIAIREKKETQLFINTKGFQLLTGNQKIDFKDYFQAFLKKKKTPSYVRLTRHLNNFHPGPLPINAIDEKFCETFKDYLLNEAKSLAIKKQERPLARNSAKFAFFTFKTCLKSAVKEKIISKNPAEYFSIPFQEVKRGFFTIEEIEILKNTPHKNKNVKNAFIFSCFTGLRVSDIRALKFSDINEDHILIRQEKTKEIVSLKLAETAKEIIKEQAELNKNQSNDFIFKLPCYKSNNISLKSWAKRAGIKKNIYFHLARHTFATLCLTYNIDLYTVSKLLGHKSINVTQIYAKLIDKKKDEAIDKLPVI